MLVIVSDLHLTDGTSGETINPGAFQKFAIYLEDMAITARARDIEIVFLGDILDVIRSSFWLSSSIRPWSGPDEKDGERNGVAQYTQEITKRICDLPNNRQSVSFLKQFAADMAKKGIPVKFKYITGNHDWLINRYPESRRLAAEFLGLEEPERCEKEPFGTEGFWEPYGVFARHGDLYDPFNYDGDRNASSLGDAIVIDLLNRFPQAVEAQIGPDEDPGLIALLREVDNVRPLIDVPQWIRGACLHARSTAAATAVKQTWDELVDRFLDIHFVRQHDKPWRLDVVDLLSLALKVSSILPLEDLAKLPLKRFMTGKDDYQTKAHRETILTQNRAEFVVYGHTHAQETVPLSLAKGGDGFLHKTYFNSGTWRKIHVRTAFDSVTPAFFGWHVMTFLAFYLDEERKDKAFEVWNGALG